MIAREKGTIPGDPGEQPSGARKRRSREEILQLVGESLRLLRDSAGRMMILLDRSGRIVAGNQAAREQIPRSLHYPLQEGQPFSMMLDEDEAIRFETYFQRALEGQVTDHVVASKREGTAAPRWRVQYLPVGDESDVAGVLFTLEPVEDRAESPSGKRMEGPEYSPLVEKLVDLVMILDGKAVLRYVSPSVERILGYRPMELFGRRVRDFIHPEDRDHLKEIRRELRDTRGVGGPFPLRVRHADGKRWSILELNYNNLLDDLSVRGVLLTARDVTSNDWAERRLELLAAAMRNVKDGVMITEARLDEHGSPIIFVSDGMAEITGYGCEELIGETPRFLYGPLTDRQAHERMKEDLRAGRATSGVTVYYRKDGSPVTLEMTISPVQDRAGRTSHFVSVYRDISDRLESERRLIASEARHRSLLEAMPDLFFLLSREGTFLEVHGGVHPEELLLPADQLIGKSIGEVLPPEIARRAGAAIERAVATGEVVPFEYSLSMNDREYHYEARINVSGVNEVLVVVRNITALRKADEERNRLVTAIEQAAESIVIADPEGTIQYVNPAFEKITGYRRAEIIGTAECFCQPGLRKEECSCREGDECKMWKAVRAGKVWNSCEKYTRKDGSPLEEIVTVSPVFDETGKLINLVAVRRDVTEVSSMETELRQMQKMGSLSNLASGIAHDFNNLLAGVLGNVEWIQLNLGEGHPLQENVKTITDTVQKAADLTRHLLTFSRRVELNRKPMDLNTGVQDAVKLLRRSIRRNIEIELQLAGNLPPIFADSTQIQQILINLCTNSADAIQHSGTIRIITDLAETDEGKAGASFVRLVVEDTGVGMTLEVKEHIFEPFYTTKAPGKGTGLGLSTVYGIVQSHGGRLEVESEPGVGTRFSLLFPVAVETEAVEERESAVGDLTGDETLLMVEDEANIRQTASRHLERLGYHVLLAADGEEGVRMFREHCEEIDCVILDMVLPKLDGLDVFQLIREMEPDVRVVIASGYARKGQIKRAMEMGARAYVPKPFTAERLARAIREVLEGGGRS